MPARRPWRLIATSARRLPRGGAGHAGGVPLGRRRQIVEKAGKARAAGDGPARDLEALSNQIKIG